MIDLDNVQFMKECVHVGDSEKKENRIEIIFWIENTKKEILASDFSSKNVQFSSLISSQVRKVH